MDYSALEKKARALTAQMTLEEKAALCVGADFWHTRGAERLGLDGVLMSDGPHGLRRQETGSDHLGFQKSKPATCFPTAAALACSFDRALLFELGQALGEECREEGVGVLLGPGVNLKRSPLCGRNFEYFSEDPLLAGELGAAYTKGVQSQKVGVSLKHFAVNNQETRRMTTEAVVDERALRELYLPAFERVVREAQPWTVMCSYNKLRGEYASSSRWLLTDILRKEWGFRGAVVSDWGAVDNRVTAVAAGLDLDMPGLGREPVRRLLAAVKEGRLPLEALDSCAERVTALLLRAREREPFHWDRAAHHALARRAAAACAVLLKNEGGLLPGKPGASAAVLGAFAAAPRYQGAGSSRIEPWRLDCALKELRALGVDAVYAPGCDPARGEPDEALLREACEVAAGKEIVYLFAGLTEQDESEGFDRQSLTLPPAQTELIRRVSAVNPNVVVILAGGSVIDCAWEGHARAILMTYLGGQAGAGGAADVLLGRVCPSGRLAESWPLSLSDCPSTPWFPGWRRSVEYRESVFVGYRFYDTAQKEVFRPFGFGLSYTRFSYGSLRLDRTELKPGEQAAVTCRVTNAGDTAGAEVAQLYIAPPKDALFRPAQELRGFERIFLQPGESAEVRFTLEPRAFCYYNERAGRFCTVSGVYELRVGSSSRDIRLRGELRMTAPDEPPAPDLREKAPCYYDLSAGLSAPEKQFAALLGRPLPPRERAPHEPFTLNSAVGDLQDRASGRLLLRLIKRIAAHRFRNDPQMRELVERSAEDVCLRLLTMLGPRLCPLTRAEGVAELLSGHPLRALRLMLRGDRPNTPDRREGSAASPERR